MADDKKQGAITDLDRGIAPAQKGVVPPADSADRKKLSPSAVAGAVGKDFTSQVVGQVLNPAFTEAADYAQASATRSLSARAALGAGGFVLGWLGSIAVGLAIETAIRGYRLAKAPPYDIRLAFADGYATAMTFATYGIPMDQIRSRWTGKHLDAFSEGIDKFVAELGRARALSPGEFLEMALTRKANELEIGPLTGPNTALQRRLDLDQQLKDGS